jgi:hypothetical protein
MTNKDSQAGAWEPAKDFQVGAWEPVKLRNF